MAEEREKPRVLALKDPRARRAHAHVGQRWIAGDPRLTEQTRSVSPTSGGSVRERERRHPSRALSPAFVDCRASALSQAGGTAKAVHKRRRHSKEQKAIIGLRLPHFPFSLFSRKDAEKVKENEDGRALVSMQD